MSLRTGAVDHLDPPAGPDPSGPPGRHGLLGEWRSALQLNRLLLRSPALARAPRGDGSPVVLIPGWRSPEASMAPVRAYLRWLGYDAQHWGFGVNQGVPERDARRLAGHLRRDVATGGRKVALVGWSLGGTVARETARSAPALISQVVTYGTPAVGGPAHTVGASAYGPEETARIAARVEEADRTSPIQVPVTAIFTRRDAVVSWTACIDRRSPKVRHVEVGSTHFSMGFDPDVWLVVAEQLAGVTSTARRRG